MLFIINVVNFQHIKFNYACYSKSGAISVKNSVKVSQQFLEEMEVSRRDTIEINDKTNKKVNNTNNNTEKNNVNTKNENKHSNKHKIRNANYNNNNNSNDKNNNNNNNKQSNELNINGTIEERLMKLESKFNILIETSDIKK